MRTTPGAVPAATAPPLPFLGAVLAGGRSSRYGRDKARASLHGRTLLKHVLASLAEADRCILVADRPYPEVDLLRVCDRLPGGGPLSGLHAALWHASVPWVAVAACDLPFLCPAYWRWLLAAAGGNQAVMVREEDGRLEPLAALYHRSALPAVEARLTAGDLALHELAGVLDTRFLPSRTARVRFGPRVLSNLNHPGALRPGGLRSATAFRRKGGPP